MTFTPCLNILAKALLSIALITSADALAGPPEALNSHLTKLEEEVWRSNLDELTIQENSIVREIQLDPKSAPAHYLLSYLYARKFMANPSDPSLLRSASHFAEQSLELAPTMEYGYLAMALILDEIGSTEKAISILTQIEKSDIEFSWRSKLLMIRMKSNEMPAWQVKSELEKILVSKETNRNIVVPIIVDFLRESVGKEVLVEELSNWDSNFHHPIFAEALAAAWSSRGQYLKAHQVYDDLKNSGHSRPENLIEDGVILYSKLERPRDAVQVLTRLLNENSKSLSSINQTIAASHLGAALLKIGETRAAQKIFLKSMHGARDKVLLVNFISAAFRDSKQKVALIEFMTQLNQEIPGHSYFHALLGEMLSTEFRDYYGSLEALQNAIVLDPERSDYYNILGLTYYKLNQFSEALGQFSTASSVNPRHASAHYNRACMLSLLGRQDEAITALESALSLDPTLATNAESDNDLKPLIDSPKFLQAIAASRQRAPVISPAH